MNLDQEFWICERDDTDPLAYEVFGRGASDVLYRRRQ